VRRSRSVDRVLGVYAIGGDATFDWFAYDEI
jgi:hypothetical protein